MAQGVKTLAYLGPRGTYSEQAATLYQKTADDCRLVPVQSLSEVVASVAERHVDAAILPVLATVSGFPAESHQALMSTMEPAFCITGELVMPVVSQLLGHRGHDLKDIRVIVSHPNALDEASDFLQTTCPQAELRPVASTAEAALLAVKGDGSVAAVCGPAAAEAYGLTVLADCIQNDPDNATLFWCLRAGAPQFGEHINRLVLLLDDEIGQGYLSHMIAQLSRLGLSVDFINTQTVSGQPFRFRHLLALSSSQVCAFAEISALCGDISVLGAYRV